VRAVGGAAVWPCWKQRAPFGQWGGVDGQEVRRVARSSTGDRAFRWAICNELFEGWPWGQVCDFVARLGYQGLEVAPFTLARRIEEVPAWRREQLRREAEAAGLQILGLHWLLARTDGLHLTSPDPTVRQATVAYLRELVRACRDLGGQLLVLGSPQQRSLLPGVGYSEALRWAGEVLAALLPDLEQFRVTLCVEPLSPTETNFLNTCAEAWQLLEPFHHPRLRLQLDVKALSSESAAVAELVRRWAPYAGHFHANDPNRLGPGMGAVDFVPILRALLEAGYTGWVSVEVFDFSPGADVIARRSIEYLNACAQTASQQERD
jgi:sugar phosphate isomerase/epimerase